MLRGFSSLFIVSLLVACVPDEPQTVITDAFFSEPGAWIPLVLDDVDPFTGQRTQRAVAVAANATGGGVDVVSVAEPFRLASPKISLSGLWYAVMIYDDSVPDNPPTVFAGRLDAINERQFFFIDTLTRPGNWQTLDFSLDDSLLYLTYREYATVETPFPPAELIELDITRLPESVLADSVRSEAAIFPNSIRHGGLDFALSPDKSRMAAHYVYTPSSRFIRQTSNVADTPGTRNATVPFDWKETVPPSQADAFPLASLWGWNQAGTDLVMMIRPTVASSPFFGGDLATPHTSVMVLDASRSVSTDSFDQGLQPGNPFEDESCVQEVCARALDFEEFKIAAWAPYADDTAIMERSFTDPVTGLVNFEYFTLNPRCGVISQDSLEAPGFERLAFAAVKDERGFLYAVDLDSRNNIGMPSVSAFPAAPASPACP